MKNIIYILLVTTFIYSCSDSDNEIEDPNPTFLEKYEGTVWVNDEIPIQYVRFIDNLNNPIEFNIKDATQDCHYYELVTLDNNDTLVNNSDDSLQVKVVGSYNIYTRIFTISGNTMEVESDTGILGGHWISYFTKSSVDFDSLPLCD